jgi:hypothetical protein
MIDHIVEVAISIIFGIFLINILCEILLDFSPWGFIKKKFFKG